MNVGRIEVKSGIIYDEAAIRAIRAKKDRMRQSGVSAAQEYLFLNGGGGGSSSRLRENAEELSDEESEFPSRVAMLGETIEKKKGVLRMVLMMVDEKPVVVRVESNVDDDEFGDEDQTVRKWEEEQVRQGLGKQLDNGSARGSSSTSVSVSMPQQQQPQNFSYPTMTTYGSLATNPSIGGAIWPSQGLDTMSISQKAENAMKALQDNN